MSQTCTQQEAVGRVDADSHPPQDTALSRNDIRTPAAEAREQVSAQRTTWRGRARLVVVVCLLAFLVFLGYDSLQVYLRLGQSLDHSTEQAIKTTLMFGGFFLVAGIVAAVVSYFLAKIFGFKNPIDWARSAMLSGGDALWVMMFARGGKEVAPDKDLYDDGIEKMGKFWLRALQVFFVGMMIILIVAHFYIYSGE